MGGKSLEEFCPSAHIPSLPPVASAKSNPRVAQPPRATPSPSTTAPSTSAKTRASLPASPARPPAPRGARHTRARGGGAESPLIRRHAHAILSRSDGSSAANCQSARPALRGSGHTGHQLTCGLAGSATRIRRLRTGGKLRERRAGGPGGGILRRRMLSDPAARRRPSSTVARAADGADDIPQT
jgi:hypothetical protein